MKYKKLLACPFLSGRRRRKEADTHPSADIENYNHVDKCP